MGLSLAEAAVRGNQSDKSIADQKQALLAAGDTEGLIALNTSIFGGATMMAKKDDDADDSDDDDGDDDDSDDDDDADDADDDEDEDDKGKKKDPRDARIEELSAEAKKRRLRARALREENEALKAENARLKKVKAKAKDDDEDEDDDKSDDDSKSTKETEALKERLRKQAIRSEFTEILANPKTKIKFKDPKVAFRLLDLDDVEYDEDEDEVDGLEDAVKALAKEAPYLLVEDEKDEDDEDDEKPARRKTGQRTGGSRKKGQPNRDALIKKYNIKR